MNPEVFISYSSHDSESAMEICSVLESHGIKCWIAPRDIQPGAAYPREITRGIRECSTFLVILSKESVHSPHVNTETDIAFNNNKQIIPFFVDDVNLGDSMSYYLARKQWIIGYRDYKQAIQILLQTLSVYKSEEYPQEPDDTQSTGQEDNCPVNESIERKEKQKSSRERTKLLFVLGAIAFLFLFLFTFFGNFLFLIFGFAVVVLILLYPQKVLTIIQNYKKQIIIVISILLGLIILWLAYLWFDSISYRNKNYDYYREFSANENVKKDNPDSFTVSREKVTAIPPDEVTVSNDREKTIHNYNLVTRTTIKGLECVATWKMEREYGVTTFYGHIISPIKGTEELICKLRLHKRSLEGLIEDSDGAGIGLFKGKITPEVSGYQMKGKFSIVLGNESYSEYPATVSIESGPVIDDILNKEMSETSF